MKREITINTLVVCGFAARPPSLARFILPRWGKSFVCSTLPSSGLTGRTVPQEFPRPFIRDSFVRCRELSCLPPLSSSPPIHPLVPATISLSSPSRRWRLLDKISSLQHRESLASSVRPFLHILPPGYFLIGCHYYPYFPSLSIVSLSVKYKLSYAGMFLVNSFFEHYLLLFLLLHISFKVPPNQLLLLFLVRLSMRYKCCERSVHLR